VATSNASATTPTSSACLVRWLFRTWAGKKMLEVCKEEYAADQYPCVC
jgi:hypothetical protein